MLLFFFNFLTAQDNQECIVNIDDPNHFIVTPEQIANAASSLPVVFNIIQEHHQHLIMEQR
tara:strand:- start:119 stop:301 length:183 start_codon:yes stop_codon:yes gene_type:complete